VLLCDVHGYSYQEIADELGIPKGTVMSRLFYARKRLQVELEDYRQEVRDV
jgi:RNA polymerase sigma-70 factor (ECF subfamily)